MNQLTPEQLDMLTRLQPKFKEAMGDWQDGDMYAVEFMPGQWKIEHHNELDTNWRSHTEALRKVQGYRTVRIPKSIDPFNPERGLWGMIDWGIEENPIWKITDLGNSNVAFSHRNREIWIVGDPFTAMLKALCIQEEV